MSKLNDFMEMQKQIVEYLELSAALKGNDPDIHELSVSMYSRDNYFFAVGSSGSEGDEWSEDTHYSTSMYMPLDFLDTPEEYLVKLREEVLIYKANLALTQKASRESYDLEMYKRLKEKFGDTVQ